MPQTRFAIAGQTFPEPSPYDRLILDRHLRFSGDAVAIIAAETEKAALKAMKLIRVSYQVLPAVLDFRTAKDNPVLVHPEEDWFPHQLNHFIKYERGPQKFSGDLFCCLLYTSDAADD